MSTPQQSTIELRDGTSKVIAIGQAQLAADNARMLVVTRPSLGPGAYTVIWHATSTDTHKSKVAIRSRSSPDCYVVTEINMKRRRGPWLLVFSLIGLASCSVPHDQLLQRDRMECAQFGFQPGTERYADCLLQLDVARHRAASHHH